MDNNVDHSDFRSDFRLFPGVDLTLWLRIVLALALMAVGATLAL